MISSGIDEYEELLVLSSSSTKSSFNLLEFPLFPNEPNWFSLIKSILISDDSLIGSPN